MAMFTAGGGRRRGLAAAALVCGLLAAAPGRADPYDALDTRGGGAAQRYVRHALQAMENGKLTEASDYCDRAIAEYPAYIYAHFTRGRVMMYAGQYDVAIAEFSTTIAAHPEFPLVYGLRAEAELRARKPQQAITDYAKALMAPVGINSRQLAHDYAMRSLASELLGQNEAALADFDLALKTINGDTFYDWRLLEARCYNAMVVGLLDSAGEACDESISRHSRNMYAYDTRGLVDLKTRNWDRAIADFTQSLYYRPEAATSLYGRYLARRAKGDSAGAAADLAAAVGEESHIADIFTRNGIPADTGVKAGRKV
jgi:tetratricopeptide (TPR) repeat protein